VSNSQALCLHPNDNVATVLQPLEAASTCCIVGSGDALTVTVTESVPSCHKLALTDIAAGAVIYKYGEAIGVARTSIGRGSHVHVHNLVSQRAQR
jgi:altronate dehydratase